jgi:hypothetical protein
VLCVSPSFTRRRRICRGLHDARRCRRSLGDARQRPTVAMSASQLWRRWFGSAERERRGVPVTTVSTVRRGHQCLPKLLELS